MQMKSVPAKSQPIRLQGSSENGYAVTESEQKQGTYELGVVATETISSGDDSSSDSSDAEATDTTTDDSESTEDSEESSTTEARLTVISAGSLIDQNITDAFSQLENTQIFMNAVSANFDGVQNLSIEAKSLGTEYNTIQHAGLFSLLVIFGIPAVILIAGFSIRSMDQKESDFYISRKERRSLRSFSEADSRKECVLERKMYQES